MFVFVGDKWTLSGNISPLVGGAHLCYHHKVTEELDVGAEIETSLAQGESVCKLAYQLEVPEASITFRGMSNNDTQYVCVKSF